MTDLFDFAEAKAAKQAAMDQVEENANQAWLDYMLELVRQICLINRTFTSDDPMRLYNDITDQHKPTTHELRALGPVMLRAAKLGYCRKANRAPLPSCRRSLHASPRSVWESLICEVAT